MKFGLSQNDYEILMTTVIEPLRNLGAEVWVFGSRARGNHQKFSDVDVLYEFPAAGTAPSGFFARIQEALENSRFPYQVDLVSRDALVTSYKTQVEQEKVKA